MEKDDWKNIKEITLKEWRKKAGKLNKKYSDVIALGKDAEKRLNKYYYIQDVPVRKFLMIYPLFVEEGGKDDERIHQMRDCVVYKKEDGALYKLDAEKMMTAIVSKLVKHVSPEDVIKDALSDLAPEDFEEVFERAVIKNGKVREKEGCYKLILGGKRGSPFQFMIRD